MTTETTMKFSTDEISVVMIALDRMRKTSSGSRPVREIAQHLVKRIEAEVRGESVKRESENSKHRRKEEGRR